MGGSARARDSVPRTRGALRAVDTGRRPRGATNLVAEGVHHAVDVIAVDAVDPHAQRGAQCVVVLHVPCERERDRTGGATSSARRSSRCDACSARRCPRRPATQRGARLPPGSPGGGSNRRGARRSRARGMTRPSPSSGWQIHSLPIASPPAARATASTASIARVVLEVEGQLEVGAAGVVELGEGGDVAGKARSVVAADR